MAELLAHIAEWSAALTELLGILVIIGSAIYALVYAAYHLVRKHNLDILYHEVRQRLGRGILLGLEFLVGADIIRTVAVELSFKSVGVLAVILVIRTFLSFTLELELTGSWPWTHGKRATFGEAGKQ